MEAELGSRDETLSWELSPPTVETMRSTYLQPRRGFLATIVALLTIALAGQAAIASGGTGPGGGNNNDNPGTKRTHWECSKNGESGDVVYGSGGRYKFFIAPFPRCDRPNIIYDNWEDDYLCPTGWQAFRFYSTISSAGTVSAPVAWTVSRARTPEYCNEGATTKSRRYR